MRDTYEIRILALVAAIIGVALALGGMVDGDMLLTGAAMPFITASWVLQVMAWRADR